MTTPFHRPLRSQGDTISGRIARADVAAICAESLAAPAARDATLECYAAATARPLAAVGLSNIFRRTTAADEARAFATGRQRRGDTWPALFAGLQPDF